MADFANPLVIGGNFNVLSTEIFFRRGWRGARSGAGRGAGDRAAGVHARPPSWRSGCGSGGPQLRDDDRQGRRRACPAPLPGVLRGGLPRLVLPWLALTVAVYGMILVGGFVVWIRARQYADAGLFVDRFRFEHGVGGWFLVGSAWPSFVTTIELSLIAMPFTAALGPADRLAAGPAEVSRAAQLRVPGDDELRHSRHSDRHRLYPGVQRAAVILDRHRHDHRDRICVPQHASRDPRRASPISARSTAAWTRRR